MTQEPSVPLPFLSDGWRAAVRLLQADVVGTPLDDDDLVVNATITAVPFEDGPLLLHSVHGPVVGWASGHADGADFAIEADYYTLKAIVLDPSPTSDALSQSIEIGTLQIRGDRDEFAAWWRKRIGNTVAKDLEDRVRAITA